MEDKITFSSYVFVNTPLNFTEIRRHWLLHLTSTLFHLWPCRRNGWTTGRDNRGFLFGFPAGAKNVPLVQGFQTDIETHTRSCQVGTGNVLSGEKATFV
jgi:hypothetical protein